VAVGETEKPAPLSDVPSNVPPVDEFHHLITPTIVVPLRLELEPGQIVAGVAVTDRGITGGFTIIVTVVLDILVQ
jgi:hypothetical protein